MKKLLTLLFLLPLFCFGQFGWSNLLSNQWVSYTDAQGSGISAKTTVPTSSEWMTKSACDTYFNLDMTKLSGYASNQWVTKSDLYDASIIPASYYQYIVSHQTYPSHYSACQGVGSTADTIYSADFPLTVTSTLFTDPDLTNPYNSQLAEIAFHPTGYRDDYFSVGSGSTKIKIGESFAPSTGYVIKKTQFYLRKAGSPTGYAVAKIYATTGADGDKICTGSALATSDNVDVSTLNSEVFELVDFNFSGVTLMGGTTYAVILEYSGGSTGNTVLCGVDLNGSHAGGNMISMVDGDPTWYADVYDCIFYVYGYESDQWRWAYLSTNPSVTYAYWGIPLDNGIYDIINCSEYSLTLDYDSFTPDYLEQSIYVNYTADSHTYTISVSDSSWMSIIGSISSGSGYFAIHVLGNSTDETRIGTVYIKIGSSIVRTITVTQGF